MQFQLIKSWFTKPIHWFMQKNVTYWHNSAYSFVKQSNGYSLVPSQAYGRLIIVSREHYQEFTQHYPIPELSELRKVLKTEYNQSGILHFIGPVREGRRSVFTVIISPALLAQFNHTTLFIPETLLLWQSMRHATLENRLNGNILNNNLLNNNPVYQVSGFTQYFLYCAEDAPISQITNMLCPDIITFSLNNGLASNATSKLLLASNYPTILANGLNKSVLHLPKISLVNKPKLTVSTLPLKTIGIAMLTVSVIYVMVVSAYFSITLDNRQQQLDQLGSNVVELLDSQQNLQAIQANAETLAQLRQDKQAIAHIWLVVITALQQDSSIQFQNIALDNKRIILRGQAEQATAVLTLLQSQQWVEDARFDAPVRRQQDKEVFVISLTLVQQIADIQVNQSEVANAPE